MTEQASELLPADQTYSGVITRPEKWAEWRPNEGDVIICTPAKCGTTWTQTMVAMLLFQTTELPDRVSALSPWLDSALSDAENLDAVRKSPSGRRVFKTHTPADGFPVWQGVSVVTVSRHPLDVFLSIRKHVMNMKDADNPDLCGPIADALDYYANGRFDPQEVDRDSLAVIVEHYRRARGRARQAEIAFFHYGSMIADHSGAVRRLAEVLDIPHDEALIEAIAEATQIAAMRANPAQFAPEGGKDFWHKEADFFHSGGTLKWQGVLSNADLERFQKAFEQLEPDPGLRDWLTNGD